MAKKAGVRGRAKKAGIRSKPNPGKRRPAGGSGVPVPPKKPEKSE